VHSLRTENSDLKVKLGLNVINKAKAVRAKKGLD
jgi:hypothetical protein